MTSRLALVACAAVGCSDAASPASDASDERVAIADLTGAVVTDVAASADGPIVLATRNNEVLITRTSTMQTIRLAGIGPAITSAKFLPGSSTRFLAGPLRYGDTRAPLYLGDVTAAKLSLLDATAIGGGSVESVGAQVDALRVRPDGFGVVVEGACNGSACRLESITFGPTPEATSTVMALLADPFPRELPLHWAFLADGTLVVDKPDGSIGTMSDTGVFTPATGLASRASLAMTIGSRAILLDGAFAAYTMGANGAAQLLAPDVMTIGPAGNDAIAFEQTSTAGVQRVAVTGGTPEKLADGSLQGMSPSGRYLVTRTATGTWFYDLTKSTTTPIFSTPAREVLVEFGPEERWVGVTEGTGQPGAVDETIYGVELATGTASPPHDSSASELEDVATFTDPASFVYRTGRDLFVDDLETGTSTYLDTDIKVGAMFAVPGAREVVYTIDAGIPRSYVRPF